MEFDTDKIWEELEKLETMTLKEGENNMTRLNWNEEFAIKFTLKGKNFSTPKGRGFIAKFDAEKEANKLKEKGATEIKIYIQKWN